MNRLANITIFLVTTFLLNADLVSGTTISFDEFPPDNANDSFPDTRYAYLGVLFESEDEGATMGGNSNGDVGSWSLEGSNGPHFSGFNGNSYEMTLLPTAGAFASFSLDVSRSNGSDTLDTFTLEGYENNVLIETVTVPLETINVWTTVSLTTTVDEIHWFSSGSGYHPYGIDNLNFNNSGIDPSVPEPSSLVLAGFGLIAVGLIGWRRRS